MEGLGVWRVGTPRSSTWRRTRCSKGYPGSTSNVSWTPRTWIGDHLRRLDGPGETIDWWRCPNSSSMVGRVDEWGDATLSNLASIGPNWKTSSSSSTTKPLQLQCYKTKAWTEGFHDATGSNATIVEGRSGGESTTHCRWDNVQGPSSFSARRHCGESRNTPIADGSTVSEDSKRRGGVPTALETTAVAGGGTSRSATWSISYGQGLDDTLCRHPDVGSTGKFPTEYLPSTTEVGYQSHYGKLGCLLQHAPGRDGTPHS